jgi:NOL1/NOP2/fmu family ribosome biogenesis protein
MSRAVFDDFVFFKRKKTWWMVRNSAHLQEAALLKVSAVGLKAFTKVARFIKPTTEMIQVFGNRANRAVFAIHEKDLDKLFLGESLSVETTLEDGYVILSHEGDFLGLGLLVNGRIRSQLPRHYAEKLMKQRTQHSAPASPPLEI